MNQCRDRHRVAFGIACFALSPACASDAGPNLNPDAGMNTGGAFNAGGTANLGGSSNAPGGTSSGGALGAAGISNSGGNTSSGGESNSAGMTSIGGSTGSGGTTNNGGTTNSGGTTGGTTSNGETTGAGGTTSDAGTTSNGGTTGGGGTTSNGGATDSGGTTSSGGTTNTGGTTSSGGSSNTAGTAGYGGSNNAGGAAGSAGSGGTAGAGGTSPNTAPGYMNLAPPMGAPFPDTGDTVTPTPPTGWSWYNVDGAICRDGSPTGVYVHKGSAKKLLIYLEGGGACSNSNYCTFNPASVNSVLAGDGQTVLGSAAGTGAGRQQPGVYTDAAHMGPPAGIFDFSNAQNPFKDWNQVYIPYCTGDVFFGTNKDATVPGTTQKQQFVGYYDMQKFVGRIVPTFKSKVDRVVLAGSSAGGFGAALNYSMVQDAFGDVLVSALDDSGPPFDDKYMPPCMQRNWRDAWGFDAAFPPDCTECRQSDGAGLVHLADFLMKKHPNGTIALISSVQDEVIRLFYSVGLQNCLNYDTANPVAIVLLQTDPMTYFPAQQYTDGLTDLRTKYTSTNRFATYYMGGANITYHQHLFRSRFYDAAAGNTTIAQFVTDFLGGKVTQIGP